MNTNYNYYRSFENYKGGINNLIVIWSHNRAVITTSTKDEETALRNHTRKLKKLGLV